MLIGLAVSAQAQVRNGFDLGDSLVDASRIDSGGPPRDGIPSIDYPKFVTAESAGFLDPDDRVIGVYRNGIAKAYPIRILDWHEIVNEGAAFRRPNIFSNSPILYNSSRRLARP
jgi:hypothetical protein